MNKDIFQGDWKMLKGKIKEKWGRLTDNDLTQINGKRDQLTGCIQKRYGLQKAAAEKEIAAWEEMFNEADMEEEAAQPRKSSRRY